MQHLPRLIDAETFAGQAGLSKVMAYDLIKKMPRGVVIKLGRRVRLDADRLADWLRAGGTAETN